MPHYDESRGLLAQAVLHNTTLVAGDTHTATSKATPVDADELPLVDSVSSFSLKKLTWGNLKATLATWVASGSISASLTTLSVSGNASLLGGILVRNGTPFEGSITTDAVDGLVLRAVSGASTGELTFRGTSGATIAWVPVGTQQFKFNDLVFPKQSSGAPSYFKGAIYFDTTLNKLRVGGATGWETVTSV